MPLSAPAAAALRRVLGEWKPSGYRVFAVSPPTRFGTPKARAFVDMLVRALATNDTGRS